VTVFYTGKSGESQHDGIEKGHGGWWVGQGLRLKAGKAAADKQIPSESVIPKYTHAHIIQGRLRGTGPLQRCFKTSLGIQAPRTVHSPRLRETFAQCSNVDTPSHRLRCGGLPGQVEDRGAANRSAQ